MHKNKMADGQISLQLYRTSSICNRFAGPNANLCDLCLSAICITTYSAFLRYNELATLRGRDI